MVASCQGGSAVSPDDGSSDTGVHQVTAYIGYPEKITIPSEVTEGDDIPIRVELSAEQRPSLFMAGNPADRWSGIIDDYVEAGLPNGWTIDLWFGKESGPSGTINNVLEVNLEPLPAGNRKIRVMCPVQRSDGGLSGLYQIGPNVLRPTLDYDYRDFPITVLPRTD